MLKNKALILSVLVLFFAALVLPFGSQAAGVDYRDLIEGFDTVDGQTYAVFRIPFDYVAVTVDYPGVDQTFESASFHVVLRDTENVTLRFFLGSSVNPGHYLDASVFPAGTVLRVSTGLYSNDPVVLGAGYMRLRDGQNYAILAESNTVRPSINVPSEFTLTFPDTISEHSLVGLRWEYFGVHCTSENEELDCFVTFDAKALVSVNTLYLQYQQTHKTNQLLDAVNSKLDENGQKLDDIIDRMDNQIQNEIDKSEEMGGNAHDQVVEVVPDLSGDLLQSFSLLTSSVGYVGTDAVLPVPRVFVPSIPGLVPEFELIPAQDFRLSDYFDMLPEVMLTLLHAVCDIALVMWAFKELYGVYQYVISLNGGSVDV